MGRGRGTVLGLRAINRSAGKTPERILSRLAGMGEESREHVTPWTRQRQAGLSPDRIPLGGLDSAMLDWTIPTVEPRNMVMVHQLSLVLPRSGGMQKQGTRTKLVLISDRP